MADDSGSSNTAIVAIVVLVLVALGLAYYFGFFGTEKVIIESPTQVIERPVPVKT